MAWGLFGLGVDLSRAQVPGIINHQGRLTVRGTNFTGLCQFKFALVNAAGDQTLWSHDASSVGGSEPTGYPIVLEVRRGVFSVNLGDLAVSNMLQTIPAHIFTNGDVWLRVWLDDGIHGFQQLSPDRRLAAAAYAFTAGNLLGRLDEAQLPATVASLNKDQTFAGIARLTNAANQVAGSFTGDGSGLTNLSGNAVAGPVARAVDFNGTLSGEVTGTQGATIVSSIGGTSAATVVAGAAAANSATSGNVPQRIVQRDANGNFAAGTVTGAFAGDGSALTNLDAAQLTGIARLTNAANQMAGSFTGDGAGLTNLSGNAVAGPVARAVEFSGTLSGEVTGPQGATVVSSIGGVSPTTLAAGANAANSATSANVPERIVQRDANGNFAVGTVTGAFIGNGSGLTNLNAAQLTGSISTAMVEPAVIARLTNAANQVAGSFTGDGSGLTNLSGNAVAGPVARAMDFSGTLSGEVTGTQGATVVSSIGGVSATSLAAGANAANSATSSNVPERIVQRDANGNFAAGIVTGAFAGNGNALTNLDAAQLTGIARLTNAANEVAGSFTGDGAGLTNLSGNAVAGPVARAVDFSGTLSGEVTGPQGATVVNSIAGVSAATLAAGANAANSATSGNVPERIVQRDANGNFAAGIVTGAFAGNGSALTNLDAAQLTGIAHLTNAANEVTGSFTGDGSGLTNLNGNAVVGPVARAVDFSGTLSGEVTGSQGATMVSSIGGTSAATVVAGAAAANAATSGNVPERIVQRDPDGNFAAGTVSGAFAGDGSALTNLNAAQLTGSLSAALVEPALIARLTNAANQVAGSFAGDGSGLTNLSGNAVAGPVARAVDFSGTLSGEVIGTQGATVVSRIGGTAAATVVAGAAAANSATSANAPERIVQRDASGNFSAGTVTGAFAGDGSGLTNLNPAQFTGSISPAMIESALPRGTMVVSASAQDTGLVAKGYRLAMSVPAPAWVNGATASAPSARSGHTALWDGQELIVWGGTVGAGMNVNSGGIWRPESDAWEPTSVVDAPAARSEHTAVWSGTEMLVWGGKAGSGYLRTGGKFRPSGQLWAVVAVSNAPSERSGHVAIWTGSRMLIWGGLNDTGLLNDGALYDPVANQWTPLTVPNPPEARFGAAAIWTGDRLLIWGGEGATGVLKSGAQLLFSAAGSPLNWVSINTASAPPARRWHTAQWTGAKMLVWGGESGGVPLNDGAAYEPGTDTWETLPGSNAPTARFRHMASWTGQEMLIADGSNGTKELAAGSAYDPLAQEWRPLSTAGNPLPRAGGTATWTGTELLVFGGVANGQPIGALQRLVPQPVWYFYRKL